MNAASGREKLETVNLYARTFASIAILGSIAASGQSVKDLSKTIETFKSVPVVQPFFDNSYGYAVWARIARGGIGLGGATGRGQVYVDGEITGFSRLVDISIGFQLGGQVYRQIVFFEDASAYDGFTAGKFEFDAQASAVAVTASARASSGTQGSQASVGAASSAELVGAATYYEGMRVFTMTVGGLMYQATIAGQRYNFRPLK